MKISIVALLLLALTAPEHVGAADDADSYFNKGLDQLVRQGYMGDTSAAQRYLSAALEKDPKHVEALWLLLVTRLPSKNAPLVERASALAALGPAFAQLFKLCKETKQQALLHYYTARYTDHYHAFERAQSEIDKALALEPQSTRFLLTKGKLLVDQGSWIKDDKLIEAGVQTIKKSQEWSKTRPNRFVSPTHYDFEIALGISHLSAPRWKEVVTHYRRSIDLDETPKSTVFAWNNVSRAYRELGQCDKAKESAENALKEMKFGAAQDNKRYAEFCIEMQKEGFTTTSQKAN